MPPILTGIQYTLKSIIQFNFLFIHKTDTLDRYGIKVEDRQAYRPQTEAHSLCYVNYGLQKMTTVFRGDRQTVRFCVQSTLRSL